LVVLAKTLQLQKTARLMAKTMQSHKQALRGPCGSAAVTGAGECCQHAVPYGTANQIALQSASFNASNATPRDVCHIIEEKASLGGQKPPTSDARCSQILTVRVTPTHKHQAVQHYDLLHSCHM
jgi:hypothetical protein